MSGPLAPAIHYAPIYGAVLRHCEPLRQLPPPWDFLPPAEGTFGPIARPGPVEAALRGAFPESRLRAAGVFVPAAGGGHRLTPALANPTGAIVPLQAEPDGPPFETPFGLLTARGMLTRQYSVVTAVQMDVWTAAQIERTGILYVTPHVQDMMILRALGLPTALTAGLATASASELKRLDYRFSWPESPTDRRQRPALALALVGWRLCPPAAGPSPLLAHTVAHLANFRRHFGFRLAGVGAWIPTPAELAAIQFAVRLRDQASVEGLVRASADVLVDFDALAVRPKPPVLPFPQALASMIDALADDPGSGSPGEKLRAAQCAHDDALRRDLVRPLQDWAMSHSDPIIQNVGVQLSTVAELLHRLTPLVIDNEARGWGGRGNLLDRYLALSRQFASLLGCLARWKAAGR